MPADRSDLARRKAAATEKDTTRGLNYNTLFALAREVLGDDVPRAIDPQRKGSRVDFFSYPIAEYLDVAWDAADRLEARFGSIDGVWFELGRRTVTGFLSSMLGRTIFSIAGHDPRRFIATGPSGYKAAVSYGERGVEWLGDHRARMTFRRDFMPAAFHRGVILTGLEASDAKAPRVEARELGFMDSEYDVRWD